MLTNSQSALSRPLLAISLLTLSCGLNADPLPGISLTSDSVTITEDFMIGDAISVTGAKLTLENSVQAGVATWSIHGGAMVEIANTNTTSQPTYS